MLLNFKKVPKDDENSNFLGIRVPSGEKKQNRVMQKGFEDFLCL